MQKYILTPHTIAIIFNWSKNVQSIDKFANPSFTTWISVLVLRNLHEMSIK